MAEMTSDSPSHEAARDAPDDQVKDTVEELEGTDSDASDDEAALKRTNASEVRRQQTAKFKSWFVKRVEAISKEETRAAEIEPGHEDRATSYVLAGQDSNAIITDPREYQLELFERAKQQNTIAVLDTGSGKTMIAVLLLRYILDQELEMRGVGRAPKISFFVVDSVTLVFQQHHVLTCNLDQKVAFFVGDMNCDLWSKEIWTKQFEENMVIVCTADVLYQCFMHSFISMEQVNLLIFDEAHHAKKDHAYARIMREFYLTDIDPQKRPRIFGMTASPVDAKVDVVKAAKELETLLHCQIATTFDLALLRRTVHRPDEQVASYSPLRLPFETPLYRKLHVQFGQLEILAKFFREAKEASSQLGAWCADHIWSFLLSEEEERRLESRVERDFLSQKDKMEPTEKLDAEVAQLRQAIDLIKDHKFRDVTVTPDNLSSKVMLLVSYLKDSFEESADHKCIVFVSRRYTARLLGDLFSRLGLPNIMAGTLLGARKGEPGDPNISYKHQMLTLTRFRKGKLNCLFATSIAEEGLDIPDCNIVIRFDLYSTVIQYIQSRGRARRFNAKFVHMIETGNPSQLAILREVRKAEGIMRDFCQSLPTDRLLKGVDVDLDGVLFKDRSHRVYIERETGAKLTYGSSLSVLAYFVDRLPHDVETIPQPNYIITVQNKQYSCEVILPENAPIRSVTGRPASRKSVAKRSAAFEACLTLRKKKYLDGHLLPTYQKQLPAMRNAQLALYVKNRKAYEMRAKPTIWAESVGTVPQKLFLTILALEEPQTGPISCQPLALLTRTPLPQLPQFPLYMNSGSKTGVSFTKVSESLTVSESKLDEINCFTLRFFKDIYNKVYESDAERMPYWIAPVIHGKIPYTNCHAEDLIDWDAVKQVQDHESLPWTEETPNEFFENKFLVDPWDGGRRYFSVAVDPHLKPSDPVPSDACTRRFQDNIWHYSTSLFKKSRSKVTFKENQPVIVAHRVLHRRNWLDHITEKEKNMTSKCYICPEPLQISALSTSLAAMGLVFPAIMFRLDSYLIAMELFQSLEINAKPDLALEAVTKDSDNTEEHRGEQVHFQRGMGRNYERLEFLGDCFLKMATSIALYTQDPDNNEFEYHVNRMLLICNKNLLNTALKLKLYEYIRSKTFSRRIWYPEEPKLLQGKGVNKAREAQQHMLGDKSIADVCEAMIGAALLSEHQGRFDNAVKAVTVVVDNVHHTMTKWDDYYALYKMPTYQAAQATNSQLDLAKQVEQKHDYHFKYPRLLRSAFIHPSYPLSWEKIPCYQRLEFLGDSLLDMTCVNFLFYRYPDRDPQWLTEHKMAIVSNKFLGALCVKLGLHKHLRLNSSAIESRIRAYVQDMEDAEEEAKGAPDYWIHGRDPPKALPDVVEAYVGAVFVDSKYNYGEVERFFEKHIREYFEDMSIYDTFANKHPTTFLSNLLTLSFGCTKYRILAQEVPPLTPGSSPQVLAAVMIHSDVVAEGQSSSGRYAKVKASSNALSVLESLTPSEFRERYQCRCQPIGSDEDDDNMQNEGGGEGKEVAEPDSGEVVDQPVKIPDEIGVAI
ncbi:MAG: Dicer-like protein 1 [Peltula sp. TS41687]|nr:MAG: Dicer-like protein 1 [Peltula sp. TS41687]